MKFVSTCPNSNGFAWESSWIIAFWGEPNPCEFDDRAGSVVVRDTPRAIETTDRVNLEAMDFSMAFPLERFDLLLTCLEMMVFEIHNVSRSIVKWRLTQDMACVLLQFLR